MKRFILLITTIIITSCESDYKVVKTEVIKGKVSAKEYGVLGLKSTYVRIYIQDSKNTKSIVVDSKYDNSFKVGDSVLFVLQQVEKK